MWTFPPSPHLPRSLPPSDRSAVLHHPLRQVASVPTREEQAKEREEMTAFKKEMEAKWNVLAEHVRFTAPVPAAAQSLSEASSLASPTSQVP